MRRTYSAICCGLLGIAIQLFSTRIFAQSNTDPFGSLDGERVDVTQLSPAEAAPKVALPILPDPITHPAEQVKALLPGGTIEESCRCVGEDTSADSAARIREALRRPLKESGLEYTDQPLEEAFGLVQEEYGIPIKIDIPAFDQAGKQPDEPVNVNLHGISLGAALRLMLHNIGLTYVIRDEVLLITTSEREKQLLQTCVYDVRDLLHDGKKGNDFDSLIDSIVSCVATESWAENGGNEAEIRPLQPGFLIISQTQSVHDEIRGLLSTIRQMNSRPTVAAGAAAKNRSSDEVVTQSYRLRFDNATVNEELRRQVNDLIVKSLPDERWDGRLADGQAVLLAVLNDRVVLRHKSEVQDTVENLLTDSGILFSSDFCGGRTRHEAQTNKMEKSEQ